MESRNKLTMCRLCLSENECFINIFEMNDWQGFVAAEVISDLLQFKVSETDCYPHVACTTCITKLTNFKLFKEYCQKSKDTYDKMFILSDSLVKHQLGMDEESMSQVSPYTSATVNPTPSNDEVISSDPIASGITVKIEPLEDEVIDSQMSECSFTTVNPTSSNDEVISSGMTVKVESLEDAGLGCSGLQFSEEDPLKGAPPDESDHDGSHFEFCERNPLGESSSDQKSGGVSVPAKVVRGKRGRFECYHCKKVYSHKSNLKVHLATHGFGRCFNCKVCGKTFGSNRDLNNHVRSHSGEKPFKCENCSARFSVISSLYVHMRTHSGSKPFSCKECSMSFSQSCHLKSHMLIHLRLKPHKCEVCHADFRSKYSLTRHMRLHS